ncbi:hypothetical protein OAO18_01450 [Francisellaceae bacterium]|nr:hypothetical protein [Francisellaceae bacterium]
MKLRFLSSIAILISTTVAYANPFLTAVAVTATSSTIATGSAVYMRNNGINTQIVNTNVGPVAIPAPYASDYNSQEPNYYQEQEQAQQQKVDFMSN